MDRFVLISGCSGSGKSTLLAELGRRGLATIEEPGRRIVKEELDGDGSALPWVDPMAFARRAVATARADLAAAAKLQGRVFFDRGLVDAAVALEHAGGEPADETLGTQHFHRRVFLTPPWPEIYVADTERPHAWAAAVDEYERLFAAYPRLGYEVVIVPKRDVTARADFVLSGLA